MSWLKKPRDKKLAQIQSMGPNDSFCTDDRCFQTRELGTGQLQAISCDEPEFTAPVFAGYKSLATCRSSCGLISTKGVPSVAGGQAVDKRASVRGCTPCRAGSERNVATGLSVALLVTCFQTLESAAPLSSKQQDVEVMECGRPS